MNTMKDLIEMFTYKRPWQSKAEEEFIERFIDPIGVDKDKIGNRIKIIGEDPKIMFSSHTDTVHYDQGRQDVYRYKGTAFLCKASSGCLGADDGTGVWMMLNMIEKEIPGVYVFHRGEECGGHGSRYILKENTDLLRTLDAAVAFDRMGTKDIITTQGGRTASDSFANSLAKLLDMGHKPAHGIFTDTKIYSSIIPECSNISVGYYRQHSKNEVQDMVYLRKLMVRCLDIDWSLVTIERDPSIKPPAPPRQAPLDIGTAIPIKAKNTKRDIYDLIQEFPEYVEEYLYEQGETFASLDKWISDKIDEDTTKQGWTY